MNGTFNKEPFITTMKFISQIRISLGYADVDNIVDGDVKNQEGVRAELFEYCD